VYKKRSLYIANRATKSLSVKSLGALNLDITNTKEQGSKKFKKEIKN
jgi:hypothetical protein